ncbi:MAG TPA: hypothetical protein VE955_08170 [Candidatus Dormibacteraeota bacterium]|nr:hypothetical protein [Candidatus Dormibacteraeota bacterium]
MDLGSTAWSYSQYPSSVASDFVLLLTVFFWTTAHRNEPTKIKINRSAAATRNPETNTHNPSAVLKTDSCRTRASSSPKTTRVETMPANTPILKDLYEPVMSIVKTVT